MVELEENVFPLSLKMTSWQPYVDDNSICQK